MSGAAGRDWKPATRPCAPLASFGGRASKGREVTCSEGCEEGKQLGCIGKGHKWVHVPETFPDATGLFHLLQTRIVTSVGKSNVTGVLYFTKPCQVPVPTKRKPRSPQVRESAKVHREGGVRVSFWALVLENASSTGKCSGAANQPVRGLTAAWPLLICDIHHFSRVNHDNLSLSS